MPSMVLGLTGRKQSGKDTFASRLVRTHGFTRVAFADPLKRAALHLNPIIVDGQSVGMRTQRLRQIVDRLGWERAKEEIPEVREILQRLGVAMREIDEDFWVRAAWKDVERATGPVVVTDCRFPNEALKIITSGSHLVRVVRPGLESDDTHESETALDNFPVSHTVVNSEGIVELDRQADGLAQLYAREVA